MLPKHSSFSEQSVVSLLPVTLCFFLVHLMASFVRRTPLVGGWTSSRPTLRSQLRCSSVCNRSLSESALFVPALALSIVMFPSIVSALEHDEHRSGFVFHLSGYGLRGGVRPVLSQNMDGERPPVLPITFLHRSLFTYVSESFGRRPLFSKKRVLCSCGDRS